MEKFKVLYKEFIVFIKSPIFMKYLKANLKSKNLKLNLF